jgi:signal transduction histidine kinase
MIRKLQKKFIMITMLSLLLVMIILVGAINGINFYQMNSRLNGALRILSENQGQFPKFDRVKPPKEDPRFGFEMTEETPFKTRYFIVEINSDGSIGKIDTSHIAAVSSSNAMEYADEVINEGKNSGFYGIYKYRVTDQSYGKLVVFLDGRDNLQWATLILLVSSGVALGILLLVFILVYVLSRKAIQPIILSMEKQKQFITDAGHEIKTPLAIISANADVLELTGGENEWITSIRNQTVRLDKLVKNLLTLSKLDEGNIELVFTDFDLSDAVYEIAEPFKAMAETQKKEFLLDIRPGIKCHGDLGSIHQLISTLVDNAIKYSNPEGTIRVSLFASKKGAQIEVYNTVETVNKAELNRFFDRFYRADSSRSRETGGYGIGLSIASSIVEAHHGKISVKSEDGRSVCFTVQL